MHRDNSDGGHPVTERFKQLCAINVECATERPTGFRVIDTGKAQPHRREEDRVIDPKFVKPFVHKCRQHRSRAISRILSRCTPKRFLSHIFMAPLFRGHAQRTTNPFTIELNAAPRGIAPYFRQSLNNHGPGFKPVPVRIDDRVRKPSSQIRRF